MRANELRLTKINETVKRLQKFQVQLHAAGKYERIVCVDMKSKKKKS